MVVFQGEPSWWVVHEIDAPAGSDNTRASGYLKRKAKEKSAMPLMSFTSLRTRLVLLVLLAAVPAFGLMLYTGFEQHRGATAEALRDAERLVRIAAGDQEELIDDTRRLLTALAHLPAVRQYQAEPCRALFVDLSTYAGYVNLGAATPNGDVFCSALPIREPINVTERAYFRRAVEAQGFAIGDYRIARHTGKPVLNFSYAVMVQDRLQAVLFATVDLGWLNTLLKRDKLPTGSTLTVVDGKGTILARYPELGDWMGKSIASGPIFQAIQRQGGEGTITAPGMDGAQRLHAYTRLYRPEEGGDVSVIVSIPTRVALAEASQTLRRNLLGLGLVVLLALGAAWVGGDRFILRHVTRLVGAAQRLAGGDLNARTGLPAGPGELDQLAHAFDHMAETLQQRETERQRAAATQARLTSILEATTDFVATADPEGKVLYFNRAARRMLGIGEQEDIAGIRIPDTHPAWASTVVLTVGIPAALQDGVWSGETAFLSRDGREIPVSQVILTQSSPSGQIEYLSTIARDISERKRAEEDLRTSREQLRALAAHLETVREEERSAIAKKVHDELGQGMTGLKFELAWVASRLPEMSPALREKATELLTRLDGLILVVRKLSEELRPSLLDVLGLAEAIEWQAQEFQARTGLECTVAAEEGIPPLETAQATALFRICQEALANVARHAQASRVTIRLEEDADQLVLSITDNGRGITDQEVVKGSSLGLLRIRERVLLLNGALTILGRPGTGTTLTVRVPLTPQHHQAMEEQEGMLESMLRGSA
jgi:PAS domain S-box-containing protein